MAELGSLDTGIIFTYFLLLLAIGIYAARRQESVEDYFIGGGRTGTFSIACLWVASWVGGAAIVGGTAKAFEFGISAGWYTMSMAIGCLLFGLFFAKRVKRAGLREKMLTYPDFIESRYDSRTRIVATITTIVAFIAFAAGQLAAAAAILQTLLGWDYTGRTSRRPACRSLSRAVGLRRSLARHDVCDPLSGRGEQRHPLHLHPAGVPDGAEGANARGGSRCAHVPFSATSMCFPSIRYGRDSRSLSSCSAH